MKKIFKSIVNVFWRKSRWQGFFEALHFFSLRGMNFGGGSYPKDSGERYTIQSSLFKLGSLPTSGDSPWIFFDVGANKGDYTEELLGQLSAAKHNFVIYSFEPSVAAYAQLTEKFAREKNVKIFNFGFSDSAGSQTLFSDAAGSGLGSLLPRDIRHTGSSFSHSETVTVATLDDFCHRENISAIDFLKLDVEGAEYRVLSGAKELLQSGKIRFLQFEFGGADIDARLYFRDFFYLLEPRYHIYRILKDGLRPVTHYREQDEIFITTNYLAELKSL